MIRYTLSCDAGHRFESWFASAAAYDTLARAGQLACVTCGSPRVEKALMAPRVASAAAAAPEGLPAPAEKAVPMISEPDAARARALAAMRAHVEAHSDDVGRDFAREARAMHEGRAPERAIHGEARAEEARKLIEDGVPVLPLPFTPRRKMS